MNAQRDQFQLNIIQDLLVLYIAQMVWILCFYSIFPSSLTSFMLFIILTILFFWDSMVEFLEDCKELSS